MFAIRATSLLFTRTDDEKQVGSSAQIYFSLFFFLVHNEFLCVSRSFYFGANLKEDVISVFELISRARGLVPNGMQDKRDTKSRSAHFPLSVIR